MSRRTADRIGIPAFVGHAYRAGEAPTSTDMTILSAEYPHHVAEALLGIGIDDQVQ